MSDYIRLNEPPHWCIQYPTCSACGVDLDTDGDGWLCPVCGTLWGMDANDGDYRERMERHRLLPDIVPEPKRPRERGF